MVGLNKSLLHVTFCSSWMIEDLITSIIVLIVVIVICLRLICRDKDLKLSG